MIYSKHNSLDEATEAARKVANETKHQVEIILNTTSTKFNVVNIDEVTSKIIEQKRWVTTVHPLLTELPDWAKKLG